MNYIDAHYPVVGQPATNSGPVSAGNCPSCGHEMYLGLVHSCQVMNINSIIGSDPRIYAPQDAPGLAQGRI